MANFQFFPETCFLFSKILSNGTNCLWQKRKIFLCQQKVSKIVKKLFILFFSFFFENSPKFKKKKSEKRFIVRIDKERLFQLWTAQENVLITNLTKSINNRLDFKHKIKNGFGVIVKMIRFKSGLG